MTAWRRSGLALRSRYRVLSWLTPEGDRPTAPNELAPAAHRDRKSRSSPIGGAAR